MSAMELSAVTVCHKDTTIPRTKCGNCVMRNITVENKYVASNIYISALTAINIAGAEGRRKFPM